MRRKLLTSLLASVCLLAIFGFAQSKPSESSLYAAAVAFLALLIAVFASPKSIAPDALGFIAGPVNKRMVWCLALAWSTLVAAGAIRVAGASPDAVVALWLTGACGLLVTAAAIDRDSASSLVGEPWSPATIAALVCVVTLAGFLRFWELDQVPRRVHGDEAVVLYAALGLFERDTLDWFAALHHHTYTTMNVFYVLIGSGTELLGVNLYAGRFPNALQGVLSVGFLFIGMRRLVGPLAAFCGATMLAAAHTHLAFSRITPGYIQPAFLVSTTFMIGSRVWIRPSFLNSAVLGLFLTFGAQLYKASLAVLPLFLAAWCGLLLSSSATRRRLGLAVVTIVVTTVCSFAPFAHGAWESRAELTQRTHDISAFAPGPLRQLKEGYDTESDIEVAAHRLLAAVTAFYRGHDGQNQYGTSRPMLDVWTAALIMPGVILALRHWRSYFTVTSITVTLGYLIAAVAIHNDTGYNRSTGALPLAAAFAGVGLAQLAMTVFGGLSLRRGLAAVLCLPFLAMAVDENLQDYFRRTPTTLLPIDLESEAGWMATHYAPRGYDVHIISWPPHDGMRIQTHGHGVSFSPHWKSQEYVRTVEPTPPAVFLVAPHDEAGIAALRERFPELEWRRDTVLVRACLDPRPENHCADKSPPYWRLDAPQLFDRWLPPGSRGPS